MNVDFLIEDALAKAFIRPSSTSLPWMPVAKSLRLRVLDLYSRVPVPISSVVSLVLVYFRSTTRSNCSCSVRPSRVDLVKCATKLLAFRHRWMTWAARCCAPYRLRFAVRGGKLVTVGM